MLKFDDKLSNTRITDLRALEEERTVETTAPQLGFKYINLRGYTINPEAIAIIDEKKSSRLWW